MFIFYRDIVIRRRSRHNSKNPQDPGTRGSVILPKRSNSSKLKVVRNDSIDDDTFEDTTEQIKSPPKQKHDKLRRSRKSLSDFKKKLLNLNRLDTTSTGTIRSHTSSAGSMGSVGSEGKKKSKRKKRRDNMMTPPAGGSEQATSAVTEQISRSSLVQSPPNMQALDNQV